MKKLFGFLWLLLPAALLGQTKNYTIKAVPFTQVKLTDKFWLPRIETNRVVTIPASFERCESTGRVKNFTMAAEKSGKFCTTFPFDDTDIYKTIEGASFSLAVHPDAKLSSYVDSLVTLIAKAQEPDGYLYTARTIDPAHPHAWAGLERWSKERELSHELYNSGHLYEAAAAHYMATKKTNLLNIALKNADLVCSVFGPGKRSVAPGHQIVEMGLVKLYHITNKPEYLQTAKFFVLARGSYAGYKKGSKDPWENGSYWQDDKPVYQQDEALGHAVRAGYLYSGAADVAALTGDDSLIAAVDRVWNNMVDKKFYVQGGIGAMHDGERFGENYDLPNTTAYNETCAAISNVYWNQRMFQLHGHAKYIDVLERSLYNGLISGVGLDGKSFFYTNAMQVTNYNKPKGLEATRSGWFECSCCPTNICRMLPSVPGYMYALQQDKLFVNLFINSDATLDINNKPVQVIQENNYPWNGDLLFTVKPKTPMEFTMMIRIPGWAQNEAIPSTLYTFQKPAADKVVITINGASVDYEMQNGYAVINRKWNKNDKLQMKLPMEIKRVLANEKVKDDIGKTALQRGPLMYCAEWKDNNGFVSNYILPDDAQFTTEFQPGLLNGVMTLKTQLPKVNIAGEKQVSTSVEPFTAIPYYAWANRGEGEMMLWFPRKVTAVALVAKD
ncbi:MAG: glycoside hydrolase family 127 protein [Bacteroidota bacterium]